MILDFSVGGKRGSTNGRHWSTGLVCERMRILLDAVARLERDISAESCLDRLVRQEAGRAGILQADSGAPALLAALMAAHRKLPMKGLVAALAGEAAQEYKLGRLADACRANATGARA